MRTTQGREAPAPGRDQDAPPFGEQAHLTASAATSGDLSAMTRTSLEDGFSPAASVMIRP